MTILTIFVVFGIAFFMKAVFRLQLIDQHILFRKKTCAINISNLKVLGKNCVQKEEKEMKKMEIFISALLTLLIVIFCPFKTPLRA